VSQPWGSPQTNDPEYLGWILVSYQTPNERFLSLVTADEDPAGVAAQEQIRECPYQVRVLELSRAAHENDDYERADDYRQNDLHRFRTMRDVDEFLNGLGHSLPDLRWRHEIDAP